MKNLHLYFPPIYKHRQQNTAVLFSTWKILCPIKLQIYTYIIKSVMKLETLFITIITILQLFLKIVGFLFIFTFFIFGI